MAIFFSLNDYVAETNKSNGKIFDILDISFNLNAHRLTLPREKPQILRKTIRQQVNPLD